MVRPSSRTKSSVPLSARVRSLHSGQAAAEDAILGKPIPSSDTSTISSAAFIEASTVTESARAWRSTLVMLSWITRWTVCEEQTLDRIQPAVDL